MSGETAPKTPKKIGRGYERNLDAGPFQPMIGSFELHLRAEKKSPKTIRTYLEAAQDGCLISGARWPVGLVGGDGAAR